MSESLYEFHVRGEKYRTNVTATKIERLFLGSWVECWRGYIHDCATDWLSKRGLYVEPGTSSGSPNPAEKGS
jgi:hypothetical protein